MSERYRPAMTLQERVASLEAIIIRVEEDQKEIKDKLDVLLALRHKGAGVFWVASMLFGTGILGAVSIITSWFRHG